MTNMGPDMANSWKLRDTPKVKRGPTMPETRRRRAMMK